MLRVSILTPLDRAVHLEFKVSFFRGEVSLAMLWGPQLCQTPSKCYATPGRLADSEVRLSSVDVVNGSLGACTASVEHPG
jgi:hypothetical protein